MRTRLRSAQASASCSSPAARRVFRSREASEPRWSPTSRRTVSSAAVRPLSRVRTATPEGPGATNGAANSRSPPTPSPSPRLLPKPVTTPTTTTGEGHAFDARTAVPFPRECSCRRPETHSRTTRTRSRVLDCHLLTTPCSANASRASAAWGPCAHAAPSSPCVGVGSSLIDTPPVPASVTRRSTAPT